MTNINSEGYKNKPSDGERTDGSPAGERENQPRSNAADQTTGCAGTEAPAGEETDANTFKALVPDGGETVMDGLRSHAENFFGRNGVDDPVTVDVDTDDAFQLLSNSRRRFVIRTVADRDEPVTIGELATLIARNENGHRHVSQVTADERKRVYVSLHQVHFDQLADAGAVAYDDRANEVHPTTATHLFADAADAVTDVVGGDA